MAFTHLHVHTEYSLLDGSNKIKEYVARVKELGMDSAAITDHGVMYGIIDFYRHLIEQQFNYTVFFPYIQPKKVPPHLRSRTYFSYVCFILLSLLSYLQGSRWRLRRSAYRRS